MATQKSSYKRMDLCARWFRYCYHLGQYDRGLNMRVYRAVVGGERSSMRLPEWAGWLVKEIEK